MNSDEFEDLLVSAMVKIRKEFESGTLYLDHENSILAWLVHFLVSRNPELQQDIRIGWNQFERGKMNFPDLLIRLSPEEKVVIDLKRDIWKKKDEDQVRNYMEKYDAAYGLLACFTDKYRESKDEVPRPFERSELLLPRLWKTSLGRNEDSIVVFLRRGFGSAWRHMS